MHPYSSPSLFQTQTEDVLLSIYAGISDRCGKKACPVFERSRPFLCFYLTLKVRFVSGAVLRAVAAAVLCSVLRLILRVVLRIIILGIILAAVAAAVLRAVLRIVAAAVLFIHISAIACILHAVAVAVSVGHALYLLKIM